MNINNYNNNKETKETTGIAEKIIKKQDKNGRSYLIILIPKKEIGGDESEAIFVFRGWEKWEKEIEVGQTYVFAFRGGTEKDTRVLVDAKKVAKTNGM